MRFLRAWIIVVDSQTLMSSWVLKRERSWLDFKTEKMGNKSSEQIASQYSSGKPAPYVFKVLNIESRALQVG